MSELETRSVRAPATTRLRMAGYLAVITAFAFAQSAGRMVADTKFDLVTNPVKFLTGGLHLWDPSAAFGQIQNQAYGYAWPMGPFFALGDLLQMPPWVVQRLWWSLLLCLAFVGIVRLAQRLGLGSPTTQVLAGFAFVLTPRITTLLGSVSVEIWPMALAPWVLLPLVTGSQRGSVRRAAALSALVVACCGGVNAVAVAATLPLGVIWILTRAAGPRKWPLLGWWVLFTGLATAWWSGPLLLLGRYSPPFLDYIENATITTLPTDLTRSLLGESDWVAYFAATDYSAGHLLVSTPFLVLDAALVAAVGLVGISARTNPHQRFLVLGVLTGLALVGLGYTGDLAGWGALSRNSALDGVLAPLRNLHKFDVVLRIPLVLGFAHAVALLPRLLQGAGSRLSLFALRAAVALALVALALPWVNDEVAPYNGVDHVPGYWYAAARYLEANDDGSVALELPATSFGVYTWGNVHDDVLQGLAASPWAVRNVIPLAQPGNVYFLDAVTRAVESGHPSTTLAPYLAANGVGRLVVRNDLNRYATGSPDPAYLRSVLQHTPGLSLARSFGPRVGEPAVVRTEGVRYLTRNGLSQQTGSVDVYDVSPAPTGARLQPAPQVLVGDPGSGLDAALAGFGGQDRVLAADATGDESGQVLTDDLRRREKNFATVRWNESHTLPAEEAFQLRGKEHQHRLTADQDRWQTTVVWAGGVRGVEASTSEAGIDALAPISIGAGPEAALDRDPTTEWRSARQLEATGQWWQLDLTEPRDVPTVRVALAAASAPIEELRIGQGANSVVVDAPHPGRSTTYDVDLRDISRLRITATGRRQGLPGSWALSEVSVPGLSPQRYLRLPEPDDRFLVDQVALTRDPDRAACQPIGIAVACDPALIAPGEDGDTLARVVTLPFGDTYDVRGTVSLRRSAGRALVAQAGGSVDAPTAAHVDVAAGPSALVDADFGTTWTAPDNANPTFSVTLPEPVRLRRLQLRVNPGAAASAPTTIRVSAGDHVATVELDRKGRAVLPGWRTDSFRVTIEEFRRAYSVEGRQFVELPPGVSGLRVNGRPAGGLTTRAMAFPCGSGPAVRVGGAMLRTRITARPTDLVRGASIPFELCDGPTSVTLDAGPSELLARPTTLFRVDSVTLDRQGANVTASRAARVERDDRGAPVSVAVPARVDDALLTLPQNFNDGWVATLDGQPLPAQRVAGWQQGWRLKPGAAGEVRLSFEPARSFTWLLLVGGLLALVVVVAACWRLRPRQRPRPALAPGLPGLLDLTVGLGAGGLLAGWWGFGAAAVGLVLGALLPRVTGWAALAGAGVLAGSLAFSQEWLQHHEWTILWAQVSGLVVVLALVAALAGARRAVPTPPAADGGPVSPAS